MTGMMMALLLVQAAPVDAGAAMQPGDRVIACVEQNFPAADRTILASALDNEQEEPPALMGPLLMRLLAACSNGTDAERLPVLLGFGHVLMAGQREVIAGRAGIAAERQAGFAAVLQPFADRLDVGPRGEDFGPAEIPDAILAQVRAALVAADFTASWTDRPLRKYLELLVRERMVRGNMNRMMAAQR